MARLVTVMESIASGRISISDAAASADSAEEKARSEREDSGGNGHTAPEKTAHVQGIENELRQKLGLRVEIRVKGKDKGQIVLAFESNDDFMRLLEILQK